MKPQKNPQTLGAVGGTARHSTQKGSAKNESAPKESGQKENARKEGAQRESARTENARTENARTENARTENARTENVKVSIMQREFTVACTAEERQGVVEAAAYFDKQMRASSQGTQALGADSCAIMAGLNISHELLTLRKSASDSEQINSRLESLHRQVDEVVAAVQS